jgi:Family of unknown function (DUF5999)
MCPHQPSCPTARTAMPPVPWPSTPSKGGALLCNGVIVFDDTGEILPGGRVVPPRRPAHVRLPVAA